MTSEQSIGSIRSVKIYNIFLFYAVVEKIQSRLKHTKIKGQTDGVVGSKLIADFVSGMMFETNVIREKLFPGKTIYSLTPKRCIDIGLALEKKFIFHK